jgi:hypothetical protein
VLAWNFAVDRLINAPDTDPVEFERACHDEASGCAYSRVWRAYLDVIQDAARRRFLSGPKLLGKVLGAGHSINDGACGGSRCRPRPGAVGFRFSVPAVPFLEARGASRGNGERFPVKRYVFPQLALRASRQRRWGLPGSGDAGFPAAAMGWPHRQRRRFSGAECIRHDLTACQLGR